MKKFLLLFLVFSINFLSADLIKVAMKNQPNNINPIYNPNDDLVNLLYLGLFYKNNNKELIPALANSYKISNDKLRYEFELKQGLHFIKNNIDFGEFTSEDVKTTYEIIINHFFNSNYSRFYNNISQINIIDKYKVEFVLKYPDNDFLNSLTLGIMSKNALIKYGLSWFNSDAIGLGTYNLKQFNNEQIVLVKNPNAIFKALNDGVVFKFYQNEVQIKNALNNDIIDVGLINYKNIKNIDDDLVYKTLESDHAIALQLNNKVIYDRKLRYAISLIICNKSILNQLPNFSINKHILSLNNNGCDRAEARKIINELGFYKDKKSIELNINKESTANYYKKLDLPLKLEIYVDKNNKDYLSIAENLAMQLKDFGILTNVLQTNNDDNEASKIVDIEVYDSINFATILNTNKINKTQAKNTINQVQENYYKEFQEQIKMNPSYVFLVNYNYFLAYNKKIKGIENMPIGFNGNGLFSQVIKWYKYE